MLENTLLTAKKMLFGTFWTVAMRMSVRLLGVISMIVLARLLSPEDFGLVAKAVMIYTFLELITELGLETSLIKDKESETADYDTVWTLHILRGIAIAAILCLIAGAAASYFRSPEIEVIIYCYAAISFVAGFYNIGIVDFRKYFKFEKDFKYNVYKKIAAFSATLTVAYVYKTYWALVVGVAVDAIVAVLASYWMSSFRPKWSLEKWRYLLNFSKWMLGYELLVAIATKIDFFVLSRYSTTANVGLYTISYEVAGTPSSEIAMPVARASMPGLAQHSDNLEEFRRLYAMVISMVLLIAVPAATGVNLVSETLTLTVLGEKWAEAAPLIEVLAFFGVVRAVYALSVPALITRSRVDLVAKIAFINVISKLAACMIGFYLYGLMGLVYGVLISGVISALLVVLVQQALGLVHISELAKSCWRIIVCSVFMYVGVMFFRDIVAADYLAYGYQFRLLVDVVLGAFLYILSMLVLFKLSGADHGPEVVVLNYLKQRLEKKDG